MMPLGDGRSKLDQSTPFGQANDRPSFVMSSDESDWHDASHSPKTAAKITPRDILLRI